MNLRTLGTLPLWPLLFTACAVDPTERVANDRAPLVVANGPFFTSIEIDGGQRLTDGSYSLQTGQRYVVHAHVNPGDGDYTVGVDWNDALGAPEPTLNVHTVHTGWRWRLTLAGASPDYDFTFTITPTKPGTFPFGLTMIDGDNGTNFNQSGYPVHVYSAKTGLFGKLTDRANPQLPIAGATVGGRAGGPFAYTTTAADGTWNIPMSGTGPFRVEFSKAGYGTLVAINVPMTPGAGIEVDAALDEPFTPLVGTGITYAPYLDYSQGRTLMHTVTIDPSSVYVDGHVSPYTNTYDTGYATMVNGGSLVTINGTLSDRKGYALNYFYDHYFFPSDVQTAWPSTVSLPLLGIKGTRSPQTFSMLDSTADFYRDHRTFALDSSGDPIWDVAPRDGVSDFDVALQCSPWLLENRALPDPTPTPTSGNGGYGAEYDWNKYFARTSVGVGANKLFFVVADAEGIHGAHGASLPQLGAFYRDVLGATSAMAFDGGLSTQMLLRGAKGPRYVNTVTPEDMFPQHTPSLQVLNYLSAWHEPSSVVAPVAYGASASKDASRHN